MRMRSGPGRWHWLRHWLGPRERRVGSPELRAGGGWHGDEDLILVQFLVGHVITRIDGVHHRDTLSLTGLLVVCPWAGVRPAVYDESVTVAGALGAPVPAVLGAGQHLAPCHPQPRQCDWLVGSDRSDLSVLDITRTNIIDPAGFHDLLWMSEFLEMLLQNVSLVKVQGYFDKLISPTLAHKPQTTVNLLIKTGLNGSKV